MAFFQNLFGPMVAFVEGTFTRPQIVAREVQILDDLQASNGSHFPGDDYRPTDRKNWMASLMVERLTLNKIVWPGTHNSATNGIGNVITRPFGECQTRSIYDQLVLGTRVLDIRVQKNRLVCHGTLEHYHVDVVLNDVIRFLSETHSEIIILEVRTEYGYNDPLGFEDHLVSMLGQFLIPQSNNLFNTAISKILPKRVICIWKPRDSPNTKQLLWNSDYLRDNWVNTDLPWTKFQRNMENLAQLRPVTSRYFLYRTENTLTPQTDNVIMDVRSVTYRIRYRARLFISQCISKGYGDKLQILSTDFIDEDFVDACIGLTHARIQGQV